MNLELFPMRFDQGGHACEVEIYARHLAGRHRSAPTLLIVPAVDPRGSQSFLPGRFVIVKETLRGVKNLTRRDAQIVLHYLGQPSQLAVSLAQDDVELIDRDGFWELRFRGEARREGRASDRGPARRTGQ